MYTPFFRAASYKLDLISFHIKKNINDGSWRDMKTMAVYKGQGQEKVYI